MVAQLKPDSTDRAVIRPELEVVATGLSGRRVALSRAEADRVRAIVLRRYVLGFSRAELARESGYAERHVQAFLSGKALRGLTAPIVAWLAERGITKPGGGRLPRGMRELGLARACADAMLRAADYLERPGAVEVNEGVALAAELRLLAGDATAWRRLAECEAALARRATHAEGRD